MGPRELAPTYVRAEHPVPLRARSMFVVFGIWRDPGRKTLTKFIPVATPRENERLQILLDMAKASCTAGQSTKSSCHDI